MLATLSTGVVQEVPAGCGRSQHVRVFMAETAKTHINHGIPAGSSISLVLSGAVQHLLLL